MALIPSVPIWFGGRLPLISPPSLSLPSYLFLCILSSRAALLHISSILQVTHQFASIAPISTLLSFKLNVDTCRLQGAARVKRQCCRHRVSLRFALLAQTTRTKIIKHKYLRLLTCTFIDHSVVGWTLIEHGREGNIYIVFFCWFVFVLIFDW